MHFLNWFKLLQDCIRAEKERSFQLQPTPGTYLFLALTPAAAQPASCIGEIDWLTRSVFYLVGLKLHSDGTPGPAYHTVTSSLMHVSPEAGFHFWEQLPQPHLVQTNTLLSHLVTQDTFIWAYLLHLLEIQTTNVEQVWHAPNNNKKYSFNLYENRPALSNFKVFITETGHCLLIS